MMRIRNKIKPEIAAEQSGFVEGKGTANGIFMLRTLIERALETQNDLYLCFIDYTKAFDRVKHQEIIKILESLNVDANDLTIIKNMYWQQSAAVRIENDYSNFQPIKRGSDKVVSFPQICSLYTANTSWRNIEGVPSIKVGGRIVNNLRYADDTVLIANSQEDLQKLLNKAVSESKKVED